MKNKLFGPSFKNVVFAAFFLVLRATVFAQAHVSPQPHQGAVTGMAFLESGGAVFSGGNDGFLIKWAEDGTGEHYQISDLPIKMLALSPNGNDIAVYESDGASLNRVSVWNWRTLTRKFAFRFTDSLTSLSYSARGTYVICGTASVSGAFFLNSSTGSVVRNKIKGNTGLVSFARTSDSEKSVIMYSPKGNILYYNLQNGERKLSLDTEHELKDFCTFNNSVFCAGVRSNNIYVIQAVTGSTINSFNASGPVLIASNSSEDLYYITNENHGFRVMRIANDRNKAVIPPELMRTFSGLRTGERIVSGVLAGEEIYAGTNLGNIYRFDFAKSERTDVLQSVSDRIYDKIHDVAALGENFYFLTSSSLLKSSYDNPGVDKKISNSGYTNMIPYGDDIILWARDSKKAVMLVSLSGGGARQLFTPGGTVQTLRLYGDSLVDVESNSSVNIFDIQKSEKRQLYQGTSIQDAILLNETDLYVAKSSGSSPFVPLIHVDVATQETVPLQMKGNVAYSLAYDPGKNPSEFYGVTIYTSSSTKKLTTSIFAYNPATRASRYLLSIADEDSEAFASLSDGTLYTNMGKSQVRSYNVAARRDFIYRRSAAMPIKTVTNHSKMLVLNRDGSVSWYNPGQSAIIADWYLGTDGNWIEF